MAGGAPESDWYAHFRKHEGARSFAVALVLSGLFHLSMVTVFRIVTYIPRHDIEYTTFTLVSVAEDRRTGAFPENLTGLPAAEVPQLALRGMDAPGGALELPTLEFAELDRLRVREDSFREPERPEDLFRAPSDDSWARFSRGLSNLPRTLQLRLLGEDSPPVPSPAADPPPLPASRPAEGFEAYVVWASEPRDRKLLFAPPIEALWGVDATELTSPVEMVLQVNPLGRVVNVFSPDSGDLVDAIQLSALQYRFAPLDVVQATNQTATLRVQRENRGEGG